MISYYRCRWPVARKTDPLRMVINENKRGTERQSVDLRQKANVCLCTLELAK